jgi:8-amino-7-oxononanoate synthase
VTTRDEYLKGMTAALANLRGAGLLRQLRLSHGIDLVSNDYLGLAEHPHLTEAMKAALETGGAGAGGSRLLRGHHVVFDEIEERLAEFCGTQAALLFSSGYAANVGLLQSLLGKDDLVVSDEYNHASLIDGIRLSGAARCVTPHRDVRAVEEALSRPRSGNAFIVTESVFSMEGDLAPLVELAGIAEKKGALLIVDEAHATGLYGVRGSGRVEELGLRERVLATVHTGGKALGSGGAWVASPAVLRETLINRARTLIFSTAPLPVLAAALHAGLDLVEVEAFRRVEVHRKAALLRCALSGIGASLGTSESAILPLIVGDNNAALSLQEGLSSAGFDARAVRPPTVPPGTARLRITARSPVPDAELLRFASEAARLLEARAAAADRRGSSPR